MALIVRIPPPSRAYGFSEQREGVIMSTSYQLLSEGRKLANDLGVSCAAWCWARTSRRTT